MPPTDQIRVLHLVGGKFFRGGIASVVRDLVKGSPKEVLNWVWLQEDCADEPELPLIRAGRAEIVNASIVADLFGALRDLPAALHTMKRLKITILHAHSRLGIFLGWMAHWLVGAPLIIHLHFLASKPWLYQFLAHTAKATVIYNSHRTSVHFGADFNSANIIFPTIAWPKSAPSSLSARRVVAASAFVANKKLDVVINACRLLQKRGVALQLIVYGLLPDSIAPRFQQSLVDEYGNLAFVLFQEWTPRWADYLKGGDTFINISDSESFGVTILEAFARGMKLVVSRRSFLSNLSTEIANVGIYYANTESAPEVSDLINAAIDDLAPSESLFELRRAVASEFSATEAAKRIDAIYKKLLDEKP